MPAEPPSALTEQPPAPRHPAWKRLLRPLYCRLLFTHPTAVFLLAGLRSLLAGNRFPDTPSPAEVGAFWTEFPPARCLEVARRIRTIEFRNRELRDLLAHCGVGGLAPLVRWRGAGLLRELHARRRPALVAGWHFRTHYFMVLAALHRLGVPAVIVGFPPERLPPGFEVLSPPKGDCVGRALVVRRALAHLRAGGVVCTALDHPLGTGVAAVPFLGRRLYLRRGLAALARLSGAPVIPVSQRWDALGRSITVTFHDPLPPPACPARPRVAFEQAVLAEAARWVERYVRAFPEELCLDLLALSLVRPQGTRPDAEGGSSRE
jgi:Bacterial lipid A biosynthesis acyltransferase